MAEWGRNPTVVIADDDALIRAVLRAALSGEGYSVVEIATAHEVAGAVAFGAPDLLILDARMPGATLTDTFAATRACAPDLPILILSGQPDPPPEASGAHCVFLSKPVSLSDLRRAVDDLVGAPESR